jgi:hypothetical protein
MTGSMETIQQLANVKIELQLERVRLSSDNTGKHKTEISTGKYKANSNTDLNKPGIILMTI